MESGVTPVIEPEYIESFKQLFDYIYQGDVEATRVSLELLHVLHVWDDIIDGEAVPNEQTNAAFTSALFEISKSWLWDDQAIAIARVQYFKWQAANNIESLPNPERRVRAIGYVYRAGFFDLFHYFAYKLHGMQWAESVAPTIATWYGEPIEQYEHEMWGVNDG